MLLRATGPGQYAAARPGAATKGAQRLSDHVSAPAVFAAAWHR